MEELTLRKAQMLARKIYLLLSEAHDVSKQLAEALDRNDQVSARILIGMRSEPIRNVYQTRQALCVLRDSLPRPDMLRLTELLNGADPKNEKERALTAQLQSNEKLLKQVLALDENLNWKIAREKSIYRNKETSAR